MMTMLNVAADRVATGRMTKGAFADLEIMSGFRANPHGVVVSPLLQPHVNVSEVATYDWVHSMLQGGTLVVEVEALLETTSLGRPELQRFLSDSEWSFPQSHKTKARQLHRVFDLRRESDSEPRKVKGTCAEFLGLYGMLRFFVSVALGCKPEYEQHVKSFEACCDIIDRILQVAWLESGREQLCWRQLSRLTWIFTLRRTVTGI